VNYLDYFSQTVEKSGVYVAFVSLPMHEAAVAVVSKNKTLEFDGHCQGIQYASTNGRPDVSDNITLVR